jgi:hypothetical protein
MTLTQVSTFYLVSSSRAILSASSQNLPGSLGASLGLHPRLFLAELAFLSVPCPMMILTFLSFAFGPLWPVFASFF